MIAEGRMTSSTTPSSYSSVIRRSNSFTLQVIGAGRPRLHWGHLSGRTDGPSVEPRGYRIPLDRRPTRTPLMQIHALRRIGLTALAAIPVAAALLVLPGASGSG